MITQICDCCKKEKVEYVVGAEVLRYRIFDCPYDLCNNCKDKILKKIGEAFRENNNN